MADILPIPTYLLEDHELRALIRRVEEITFESGRDFEERDRAFIDAAQAELRAREAPVTYDPVGDRFSVG